MIDHDVRKLMRKLIGYLCPPKAVIYAQHH